MTQLNLPSMEQVGCVAEGGSPQQERRFLPLIKHRPTCDMLNLTLNAIKDVKSKSTGATTV